MPIPFKKDLADLLDIAQKKHKKPKILSGFMYFSGNNM